MTDKYLNKHKNFKTECKYEFSKSMMYAIQALTGEKTHEIMARLVGKADDVLKAHEIDINEPIPHKKTIYDYGRYNGRREIRDYTYYPDTELYLGIYLVAESHEDWATRRISASTHTVLSNSITYRFKLPTTSIKLDQREYDEIALDGIILEESMDLENPELKKTMTPAELKAKEEAHKAKIKARKDARAAAKAAKKANKP